MVLDCCRELLEGFSDTANLLALCHFIMIKYTQQRNTTGTSETTSDSTDEGHYRGDRMFDRATLDRRRYKGNQAGSDLFPWNVNRIVDMRTLRSDKV